MLQLKNKTQNLIISKEVEAANTFSRRLIGLIGKPKKDNYVLWIKPCNSVHTFFMSFSIDLCFVDKNLIVKKIVYNVRPWKLIPPVWGAKSVFELPAGTLSATPTRIGDQLDVIKIS